VDGPADTAVMGIRVGVVQARCRIAVNRGAYLACLVWMASKEKKKQSLQCVNSKKRT
jgi:hypothetical protein